MELRELVENDLQPLLALYRHLHASDTPEASEQVKAKTWQAICNNADIRYFGVFENSALVASCNITIIPNLTRSCQSYGVIENVVTHEKYRRRGYGHAVLQAALDFAWQHNCYKVMLMTGRLDEETFNFYETAGFKRHEKEAFIAKPGKHEVLRR